MEMTKPLDQLIVTQGFGERPDYYGPSGHQGVDFRTKFSNPKNSWWNNLVGHQPCYAIEDGICTAYYDKKNYGTHVWLEGVSGNRYIYAHLKNARPPSAESVVVGPVLKYRVKAGEVMAITDNTGKSTGAHLHFGYKPKGVQNYADPMQLFNTQPQTFKFTYISDTDDIKDAVTYCDRKFKEFSGGLLGVNYVFQKIDPVTAPIGSDLPQETASHIVEAQTYEPCHGVVLGHGGSNASQGFSTYTSLTKNIVMSSGYKPWNKDQLIFEIKHQAILYYNIHRGSNPFIEVIDSYTGGLEIVKKQIQQVTPYLSVFKLGGGL